MPQLQILNRQPGFGEELGAALGGGLSQGISGALTNMLETKKNKQQGTALAQAINKPELADLFGSLGPEYSKVLLNEIGAENLAENYRKVSGYQSATAPSTPTGLTQPERKSEPNKAISEAEPTKVLSEMTNEQFQDFLKKAPPKQQPKLIEARQKAEKLGFQRAVHQDTRIDKSHERQKEFIDKTTNQYKAFETETKPKLLQMQKLNNDQLIKPSSAKFLDTVGLPLGVLENPSNELYQKLSQDLLKGLPETYGSKILQVEVENFLKTIPTLMNSADGRRMIASNMLKLGEMKELFYNEMRRQQKEYVDKEMPRDFEQNVFDQIKPQIDKINNEFVKLSEIKSVPPNTVPFFNPMGEISFVPNTHEALQWATENGGKRVW